MFVRVLLKHIQTATVKGTCVSHQGLLHAVKDCRLTQPMLSSAGLHYEARPPP